MPGPRMEDHSEDEELDRDLDVLVPEPPDDRERARRASLLGLGQLLGVRQVRAGGGGISGVGCGD